MPYTTGILAQQAVETAGYVYDLLVVPDGHSCTIAVVNICNRDPANNATFSLWTAKGGEHASDKQASYSSQPALATQTLEILAGVPLGPNDRIRFSGSDTDLSIQVYGTITPLPQSR